MNAGYPDRSFPDNLHRLICSILIINFPTIFSFTRIIPLKNLNKTLSIPDLFVIFAAN